MSHFWKVLQRAWRAAVGTQVATHATPATARRGGRDGHRCFAGPAEQHYQFASYCIRLCCACLAKLGDRACRFVYHCCSVFRSLRADLFQRSEGEGRGKESRLGSRIGELGWMGGRGGGILMVADYAADFTRLGLLPVPASSTLCARQAKKPLYVCGGGGGKGLGNDSRKSARACRASLK